MAGWAIGAVSFVLVVNALVGENGYLATMRKQADQRELAQSLDQLRQENQRMREQIDGIKNDPRELEDAARRYLHMTKPGEKVIIVTPKATPSPLPKSPAK
jgi:cell division protein FtsB